MQLHDRHVWQHMQVMEGGLRPLCMYVMNA